MGIETSCDETAAGVVREGKEILSNVVASQVSIHKEFWGIVPEIASRKHIEVIIPVIRIRLGTLFMASIISLLIKCGKILV